MSPDVRLRLATFILGLQQALLIPFLGLFAVRGLALDPLGVFTFLAVFHGAGLIVSLGLPAVSDKNGHGASWFQALTMMAVLGFALFALSIPATAAIAVAACLLGPASAQNSLFFGTLRRAGTARAGLLATRGLFTVAWVAGPVLGSLLESNLGFGGLFGVLCVLNVVVLLLRPLSNTGDHPAPRQDRLRNTRTTRLVTVAFVTLICLHSTNVIATTTMPIVVDELGSGRTSIAGLAFATSAGVEAVILFCLARWSGGRSEGTLILIGCIPGALYYLLLATTTLPWLIVVAQPLNAMFIAVAVGVGMTWFQSMMPNRPGLATGLFMNASRIASLATAPVIGASAAWAQSYQAVSLLALLLLVPAAASLMWLRTRQTPRFL